MESDVIEWTCEQVAEWLKKVGFEKYVNLLIDTHKIDGQCLLQLSERDLKEPPLNINIIGDLKRLVLHINRLCELTRDSRTKEKLKKNGLKPNKSPTYFENSFTYISASTASEDSHKTARDSLASPSLLYSPPSTSLKPEFFKLLVSWLYMMFAFLTTTFVMVIVHDRVPNMQVYPPLPDIVLDNVPYMPWAFDVCEAIILSFFFVIILIFLFHKYRFIIARRLFAMLGTVFLLRCVTMLITSLSVPGTHLKCEPRGLHTVDERIEMALKIYSGFGMSLVGVRTCGDYLFSGHTVVVTIFNFFINEYTSSRFSLLHTLAWIGNFFAIFFILAAHEHYSIDVFIAFYITSRLFLYYHSLANNKVLMQQDSRTQVWFPLFSYFEVSINGRIPNDFEPFWISFYHFVLPSKRWSNTYKKKHALRQSPGKTKKQDGDIKINNGGLRRRRKDDENTTYCDEGSDMNEVRLIDVYDVDNDDNDDSECNQHDNEVSDDKEIDIIMSKHDIPKTPTINIQQQ